MESVIYMPLVGEGTDCWRPVRARKISEDIFEVVDAIGAGESWAFAPGSRLKCREHIFTTGESGLVAFEYALASNVHYQLLKKHEGQRFRVVFTGGEEAVIKVLHVDEEYEDFIYDLVSTNLNPGTHRARRVEAYASKFVDLVSAQLVE